MKPPKRLTDPDFHYVHSNNTDIRKTFARIRREMKQQAPKPNVVPLVGKKK